MPLWNKGSIRYFKSALSGFDFLVWNRHNNLWWKLCLAENGWDEKNSKPFCKNLLMGMQEGYKPQSLDQLFLWRVSCLVCGITTSLDSSMHEVFYRYAVQWHLGAHSIPKRQTINNKYLLRNSWHLVVLHTLVIWLLHAVLCKYI